MEHSNHPPALIVTGSLCKEDIIEFLKSCDWQQMRNGKHYVGIVGFLQTCPDKDGFNAFFYEHQKPDAYGTPKRQMWRASSRPIAKQRRKQFKEYREQNPELFFKKKCKKFW